MEIFLQPPELLYIVAKYGRGVRRRQTGTCGVEKRVFLRRENDWQGESGPASTCHGGNLCEDMLDLERSAHVAGPI